MNVDRSIINGWLNIFKEQGYTSSHIVRSIKKRFKIKTRSSFYKTEVGLDHPFLSPEKNSHREWISTEGTR